MSNTLNLELAEPGGRRRYRVEQKRAHFAEAEQHGESISSVARRYGISPSVIVLKRRAMHDASNKSLMSNERVVPRNEVTTLGVHIRGLERALGPETMDVEVPTEAVKLANREGVVHIVLPLARVQDLPVLLAQLPPVDDVVAGDRVDHAPSIGGGGGCIRAGSRPNPSGCRSRRCPPSPPPPSSTLWRSRSPCPISEVCRLYISEV